MCLKAIGTNSIFCGGCSSWMHKKYSGIPGSLKPDISFKCKWCTGQARPIDGRLMTEVTLCREILEVVISQDVMSLGASSISSCPSSPPAHFPSSPEEEFTIHVSGVPCFMQCRESVWGGGISPRPNGLGEIPYRPRPIPSG